MTFAQKNKDKKVKRSEECNKKELKNDDYNNNYY